jgi:hypothetical protein
MWGIFGVKHKNYMTQQILAKKEEKNIIKNPDITIIF